MKIIVRISAVMLVCASLMYTGNAIAQVPATGLGSFEKFTNVGGLKIGGKAKFAGKSQTYSLAGAGSNIWLTQDSFAFLSKKINGDFILQTQFRFLGTGHELHRKAGLMVRRSTETNSPLVACTVHGDGLTSLQYRSVRGGVIKEIKFGVRGADVVQLEKKGNRYTMSAARFGGLYEVQNVDSIDLGSGFLAGLFICAHTNGFTEEAEFINTKIFAPASDSLVPYQTYIGSELETMDVATGKREVLARNPGSLQAPNWTPDGKSLIYNEAGKLIRFELHTKIATVINTGFATKNNNDHVLTFDGKQIGISHHDSASKGQSVVYRVPVGGGIPIRVTQNSPSYFHGWSPDSRLMLFTGERNGDFDVYQISKDGGKETRLTNVKGLDDGPEYAPNGKTIYFCSTRTGKMQVWRMDPDGSHQLQLTFDELNNWFPHVSPDGKWLVFLSFSKEIPADKHPFYQRVYIRLMPVTGGEPKVIAYLYGGQGSINVPSWAPDSRKIAFVSNGIF